MININLLPPQEKKELLAEESKRLILVLGFVVLFASFCLIMALTFLRIYLLIQIDSQEDILELAKEQTEVIGDQDIIEKINDSNKKLIRINDFYNQKPDLEEALEKLNQTIPKGIYFTNLSYSKTSSQITLAGFSSSQELLKQFKENLEQRKEDFTKIYLPTPIWNELLNINFAGVIITLKNEDSK